MNKEKIFFLKRIILIVFLFLLLGLALSISSGKVRILFAVLAVLFLAISLKWPNKLITWCMMAAVLFLVLSVFYNARNLEKVLPMTHGETQSLYQLYDYEQTAYPDSLLRLVIKDKTVEVPYKIQTYDAYNQNGDEEQREEKFARNYYTENNYTRYFMEYAGNCVTNESLLKCESVSDNMVQADFTDLGIANDMLRYSFLLNHEDMKEASYFWYAWYYYSFADEEQRYPKIYLYEDGIENARKLVAVWDEDENLYLMPYTYYESKVENAYESN